MTDEFGAVLKTQNKRAILSTEQCPSVLEQDLVELERKLIPLLNRTRAMLGKPPIIAPKSDRQEG